jgi:hypothetical protein
MATVIKVTSRVLTPAEAEARRKRLVSIIEKVELELMMKEEKKDNEQTHK